MTDEKPASVSNAISGGSQYGPLLQAGSIQASFQLPPPAPVALDQLPAAVAGFTGRADDLAVLAGLLDPAQPTDSVVVSAVAGLAGVGKTSLAIQAGHAARQNGWYPGGVLFIDFHGYDEHPVQPAQALDALLRALGVPAEHIPPGAEARAGLYRSVLAQVDGPVLVVGDNVSSEAQIRPLLPGAGAHRVLITSRNTLAGLSARLVDLTVLDDADACALLGVALRAARPADDRITASPGAAMRLARVCGGLPLALQIIAAILKSDPSLSAAELADELSAEQSRLGRLVYDDLSGAAALSVAAAFELSYRRLNDTLARLFRLMPTSPGPDVSTAATAVLVGLPVAEVRPLLARLAQAHLVEPAPEAANRWRMHDLVRLYARRLSNQHVEADSRDQALDRLLDYYLRTAQAADSHLRALSDETLPTQFTGRNDALAWLDAERASLVAGVIVAAESGRDQVAMRLPLAMASYLTWRRRFDDCIATVAISLKAARDLEDRTGEGVALNNLGATLPRVRRFEEAITACQDAAAIYRETGDRRREGMALGNLALALQEVRRFELAVTTQQEALAIFRETGDRHDEGSALGNLGIALQHARRFEEAITACHAAIAIYRETGDRHGEGATLGNLGSALLEARRFGEAITAYRDAAAIYQETGDRHGEGGTLNNLGAALRQARRIGEAITAHRDAAAIYQETGDRHSEGGALNNLGLALQELRRFDDAITAHQDAAVIFRQTGDRHGEGDTLTNLGVAWQGTRRFEEAITAHQDAAAAYRETGDRHGEGTALNNLGIALQEVRRFGEAIAVCQAAAAAYRETSDRHGEGGALTNLGAALQQAQRLEEAITAHREAATIFRQTGDRHGEGRVQTNLGAALQQAQRFEEAITAHQEAATIFRQTGDRHGEGLALNNLGLALRNVRRLDEAITAHQDAVAIFRQAGDRHGERIAAGNLLAAKAAQT